MSEAPYMQFYVGDYLADTQHLDCVEHGAYCLLLFTMWRCGGTLQNDPKKLARICRLTPSRWANISDDILSFFTVSENEISHKRIQKDLEKFSKVKAKRVCAGRKGGEAKALKTNNPPLANGIASATLRAPVQNQNQSHKELLLPNGSTPNKENPAVTLWNELAAETGLSKVQRLTANRQAKLNARLRDCGGLEGWEMALAKIRGSPFLLGDNERGWKANFDFLLQESSFTKLMEDTYERNTDNRTSKPGRRSAADRRMQAFLSVAAGDEG